MATYLAIESCYGMQLDLVPDLDLAAERARQTSCLIRDGVNVSEREADTHALVRYHGIAFRGSYVRIEPTE